MVVTIVKRFPFNASSPVPCLIGQEQIQRNADTDIAKQIRQQQIQWQIQRKAQIKMRSKCIVVKPGLELVICLWFKHDSTKIVISRFYFANTNQSFRRCGVCWPHFSTCSATISGEMLCWRWTHLHTMSKCQNAMKS